jgi:hypothetical protein
MAAIVSNQTPYTDLAPFLAAAIIGARAGHLAEGAIAKPILDGVNVDAGECQSQQCPDGEQRSHTARSPGNT